MASIERYVGKKGISWNVRIRKGKKLLTGTFKSKRMAEDWVAQQEGAIVQEKYFPSSTLTPPPDHTVTDVLDIYEARIVSQHSEGTQDTYRKCLVYWRSALGDTSLKQVTPALIENCRYYLLNTKGLDPQTVNLYVASIAPAFTYAASDSLNWITTNPFTKIKKLKEKPGRAPQLTDQQVRDLLEQVDKSQSKYLWLYVRLLLCSGARKQEALRLKWEQVNFKRGTVTFIKTKSRAQRTVPLPSYMVDMLKEEYDSRFGEMAGLTVFPNGLCLFPSPKDPRKPMINVHVAYGKARARAGLPHIRLHDLRHHYASRMILDGGSDILAVSVLLGHANLKQTQRYAHLTHSHIAAQVEAMGNAMSQTWSRNT